MTGRMAHLDVHLGPADSPSTVYAQLAEALPGMVVFGPGAFRDLRRELHSIDRVAQWVATLSMRLDKPVFVHLPADREGESRTIATAPPWWTEERLKGFIAGQHEELEATYGTIAGIRTSGRAV